MACSEVGSPVATLAHSLAPATRQTTLFQCRFKLGKNSTLTLKGMPRSKTKNKKTECELVRLFIMFKGHYNFHSVASGAIKHNTHTFAKHYTDSTM